MHSDQVFYFRLINVFKMFQFFFCSCAVFNHSFKTSLGIAFFS